MLSPLRLVALLFLAGCASSGPVVPPPSAVQIEDAQQAVENARAVGAETASPTEFRAAESHLMQAMMAMDQEDHASAARLLREATVDAQLAEASAMADRAARRARIVAEVEALRTAQ